MGRPIGFAFWAYDLFPYLLGAEFTKLKGKQTLVPSIMDPGIRLITGRRFLISRARSALPY